MTNSSWNKRAVAGIAVAALVGVLSPISASALDEGTDEVITATMDLGSGNNGGGGGGGETCSGYSSLVVPTNTLPLTYQTIRAKNPAVAAWIDDPLLDGLDGNTILDDDTAVENFPFEEWNTQRDYVSDQIQIEFDANNCLNSEDWATLEFDRMPVERNSIGGNWYVAEMTTNHGILAADAQRAVAELMLDRGLVNGNVSTRRVFDELFDTQMISNGDFNSEALSDWQSMSDDLSNLSRPQGTSGVANVSALITLFGDEAKGKYRARFGINMVIND